MTYSVYILLLIGLLLSVLINWFPKGIPQVVLIYKAELAFKALKIKISKQGQFEYMKFENEPDTDTLKLENKPDTDALKLESKPDTDAGPEGEQ